LETVKILPSAFKQIGRNFVPRAKKLDYARNRVRKLVRRQKMDFPLEDLPRQPKRSPRQRAQEIEELVERHGPESHQPRPPPAGLSSDGKAQPPALLLHHP